MYSMEIKLKIKSKQNKKNMTMLPPRWQWLLFTKRKTKIFVFENKKGSKLSISRIAPLKNDKQRIISLQLSAHNNIILFIAKVMS